MLANQNTQAPSTPGFASSVCPNCGSPSTVRIFRRETTRAWYLARCNSCNQHFTDPHPTLDDIVSFYGDGYHEELLSVEMTRAAFGPKFQSYIDWIAPHLRPGGRTLDVGCSTGLFPSLLKERGFAAEGLELNSRTAEFGRQQFGIPITNQPFETADYAASSFTLVSMTDVLEHSLSPIVTLQRVHNILEDGGHALITFPDITSVESQYFHACAKVSGRDWLWQNCHVPLHTWEFTRPTAEALFRKTGFQVTAFRRSHVVLEEKREKLVALLNLPARLLSVPPLSRLFGTQLEFLIQKT